MSTPAEAGAAWVKRRWGPVKKNRFCFSKKIRERWGNPTSLYILQLFFSDSSL